MITVQIISCFNKKVYKNLIMPAYSSFGVQDKLHNNIFAHINYTQYPTIQRLIDRSYNSGSRGAKCW